MIDLTPLEVRKKKGDFRRQLRGYDPAQVDDFLDVVADRLESVVRENMSVAERVARLEQQVTEYRDRERALTEALVTAQEMREQMRSQTTKEVELAKRQAVQDAERIRIEAEQDRDREEDNIRRLRQRQRQLLQSFRTFLERELSELVVFGKALEMDEAVPDAEAPRSRSRRSAGGGGERAAAFEPGTKGGASAGPATEPPVRPPSEPVSFTPPAAIPPTDALAGRTYPPEGSVAPPPAVPPTSEPPAPSQPGGSDLDPFGDMLESPASEPPTPVHDAPEPVAGRLGEAGESTADALADVTDDDLGALFSTWDEEDYRAAPGAAEVVTPDVPGPAVTEPPTSGVQPSESSAGEALVSDETANELADELEDLLQSEQELFLSDADVLEDPATGETDELAALENVSDADADEWVLDDELLMEEEAARDTGPAPEEERAPDDQPVDLSMLPDDELSHLNLDDLGLPPLQQPGSNPESAFGPSGLTLRPLSSEEDAPDVPREPASDEEDDDDMFSTLFGRPR